MRLTSLLGLILLSQSLTAEPLKVLIDPGHGGTDRGAVQRNVAEADITLNVSKALYELLKKDARFKPVLTRSSNDMISLEDRTRMVSENKADLLLSIHANSNPEKRVRGAEFYFQNQLAPDEESLFLAHQENPGNSPLEAQLTYSVVENSGATPEVKAILSDLLDGDRIFRSSKLTKNLKEAWTGTKKSKSANIRQAPFFVLSQVRVPSALVELGFLTNQEDFKDLTSPAEQARMAQNILRALVAYKESID